MPPIDGDHHQGRPRRSDEVGALLDRDEDYDQDPVGDPPITVSRYRAAIRAMLAAQVPDPGFVATAWSQRETEAFLAGSRATLRLVVEMVGHALTTPPPTRGVD
ncbi:conserved hypothetical protein [Frankia canadensis]|uniref:Uncharacterized protein n=1 Tax=Frankia canadensis TaxID=1836972 RepID=A0A2I2KW86_9ACTN|nr:hypothetical protein [Frankia canadensis]SNQ49929.1 conserved hypothetical protein [Frankia canadensis]SOU57219.1 conserved hypothetical protein [Frankia canadensis]